MTGVDQFQWRELNRRRNYPFTDTSTLTVGSMALPKEWAIDAIFTPNKAYKSAAYYFISRVSRTDNLVTLTLSSQIEELATSTFDIKSTGSHIKFYNKIGERYAGSLIVNPVYNIALGSFNEGDTRIPDDKLRFIPSVVHPVPFPSVTGLVASTGGKALSGEAYLVGGEGVTLTVAKDSNLNVIEDVIRVDIDGDANYARVDCEPEQTAYIIDELKGIVPCKIMDSGALHVGPVINSDDQGGFTIAASDVWTGLETDMYDGTKPTLRIYPKNGRLYFEIAGLSQRL
jgi:hypothetical protein